MTKKEGAIRPKEFPTLDPTWPFEVLHLVPTAIRLRFEPTANLEPERTETTGLASPRGLCQIRIPKIAHNLF